MRDEYNVRNIAASYKFDESYEMNIYINIYAAER